MQRFLVLVLCISLKCLSLSLASIATHDHNILSTATEAELDATGTTVLHYNVEKLSLSHGDTKSDSSTASACYRALQYISKKYNNVFSDDLNSATDSASLVIHRNGQPESCSNIAIPLSLQSMERTLVSLFPKECDHLVAAMKTDTDQNSLDLDNLLTTYQMEAFLTEYIATSLTTLGGGRDECNSTSTDPNDYGKLHEGFYGHCDMGVAKTVRHKDFDEIIRVPKTNTLPCRWYSREGLVITSIGQLAEIVSSNSTRVTGSDSSNDSVDIDKPDSTNNNSQAVSNNKVYHLYAVPSGRVFMFAPKYIGEEFVLNHVTDSTGNFISLKVLSLEPRVFDIFNFFSLNESESILQKSLKETSSTHRFHRSTTGTGGASVFSRRTSENAWDTSGETASIVKRRCFKLLGFEKYDDAYADGLQVLRYNETTAYVPHMDYLDDKTGKEAYDYDTSGKGGNRFATILMYFNDLPENGGGETVFSRVWPPNLPIDQRIETKDMIKILRESGEISKLKPGSWEEEMVANCRTKLAVKPYATRAVLFYSQYPDGREDPWSYHGGCPVLNNGTKYAANLWTWSGIRPEYEGAPLKRALHSNEVKTKDNRQLLATFRNKNKHPDYDNAQLFYDEASFFGDIGPEDPPIRVNTYQGHVWNVKDKVTGKVLATFVIDNNQEQEFSV